MAKSSARSPSDKDPALPQTRRARRRLIGAAALAIAAAIILTLVLDSEPREPVRAVEVSIPPRTPAPADTADAARPDATRPDSAGAVEGRVVPPTGSPLGQPPRALADPPSIPQADAPDQSSTGSPTGSPTQQPSGSPPAATDTAGESAPTTPAERPVAASEPPAAAAAPPKADEAPARASSGSPAKKRTEPDASSTARTADSTSRPAARNADKPAARTSDQPAARKGSAESNTRDTPAKTAAKPSDKPTAKPTAKPAAGAAGRYAVQVGAFSTDESAQQQADRVRKTGLPVYTEKILTSQGARIRVRAGPFGSAAEAERASARLKLAGVESAIIKP